MTDRVKIGVAGCGLIARQVHLPLLSRRRDAKIVALIDENRGALAQALAACRGAAGFTDLDTALADAQLDALVIALPTALHAPAARAALQAGVHIYVEKPLAGSLADAARVLDTWRGSDLIGMVGFNCRDNPLHLRLRELLAAGRAGVPTYVHAVFATAPRFLPEWKRQRATGGGALLDLGAHHIDLLRALMGEVAGVRATIATRVTEHDTALLELEFASGVRGHGYFSLRSAETDRIEVHGELARLSVARFTSLDVDIVENPGGAGAALRRIVRRAGTLRRLGDAVRARRSPLREPGYAVLLDRFVRASLAARAGLRPRVFPDLADGFACMAVIAAAERSIRTGRLESPAAVADEVLQLAPSTP